MTFRLLVNAPFPEDGTSQYRAWGPITELRKLMPDLEIISCHTLSTSAAGNRLAWPEMGNVDAVMLQRPFAQDHLLMTHLAKLHKKPIWVDYDDDLFSVPEDNPTHWNYSNPQHQENIKNICRMADVVTTSTKFLGEKLAKFNPKVLVVPNALNLRLLTRMDPALPRNKCVLWRGSHCHFSDLFDHTKELLAAYNEFPDWSWVFVGYNPTWITKQMDRQKRVRIVPFDNDYMNYMETMKKMRAAVQIIPLVPIDFNFSKSNVGQLEASFAGSAILAPAWEEWDKGHMWRYSGATDFQEKLFQMLNTPLEQLAEANKKDWDYLEANRSLKVVNEFRRGILEAFKRQS